MSVYAKKQICSTTVKRVIVPLYNYSIIEAKNKKGKRPHDFVRFIVYEKEKVGQRKASGGRMLFINDHRETTYLAARDEKALAYSRTQSTEGCVMPKTSLAKVVRLPAFVVVVERETEGGTVTFINLFPLDGKKATGVFVVFPQFLVEEKLFLDKIVKYEPLWWWGGRVSASFGPSGETLPLVAITDESKKIMFHCRKSGDLITLSGDIETMPNVPS